MDRHAPGRLVTGVVALAAVITGCTGESREATSPAGFLEAYTRDYVELRRRSAEADWALNTRIVAGDTTRAAASERARLALAAFGGSDRNIAEVERWLARPDLAPLERRQLEAIRRAAAEFPESAGEAVRDRVRLENRQVETLFGYDYRLDGRPVSAGDIDAILRDSRDDGLREAAWVASKEVGRALRDGVLPLRDLRNASVRELGYADYFDFKASGYGLDRAGVLALSDRLIDDIWPLYREIHTWARYELADRYGTAVPDLLPAHWLPDRWGQDWSPLLGSGRSGLDVALADRDPAWIVEEAERFYRSLGFEPLPDTFWERSSLYPAPADAPYRKNSHASAWHVDLDRDVRALMSVESNARWYETTHHELGHIYYYLSYARPEVPPLLRSGANRAFHEAIGSLLGLAATQDRFLRGRGLVRTDDRAAAAPQGLELATGTPELDQLFREALRFVSFMPWSAGVMTRYESELYGGGIDERSLNARWWELKRSYQGIAPPSPRDEAYADAASKTHLTNDPAEYYDYALSHAILFQLHERIASDLLKQDPHDTDYFGSRAVGEFLRGVMRDGATRPWEDVLGDATGRPLDGTAIADYFAPLLEWLRAENAGRRRTLPARSPAAGG